MGAVRHVGLQFMTRQERVVRYVLEYGPCTDTSIFANGKRDVSRVEMRRLLKQGAPDGMVAYESESREEPYDLWFVFRQGATGRIHPYQTAGRWVEEEGPMADNEYSEAQDQAIDTIAGALKQLGADKDVAMVVSARP